MKNKERSIALQLRMRGLSYNEILDRLHQYGYACSKASLSNWLKEVELTDQQKERLTALEDDGKAKGRDKIARLKKARV